LPQRTKPGYESAFEARLPAGLDAFEEVADDLEIPLRLLEVRHVRALLEDHPLGARDPLVERLDQLRSALVMPTRGDQRRDADLAEPADHVPALQRARDRELVRPPHRLVDLLAELRAGPLKDFRLRVEPADVPPPELLLVEPRRQASRLFGPAWRARGRGVEHEAREPARLRERVLEREHPSPRGSEQVDPFELEPLADALQLLDEDLDRPERRIVRPVRSTAPELVVEDDASPALRQRCEPLERVVRAPGPAVQHEQRQAVPLLP